MRIQPHPTVHTLGNVWQTSTTRDLAIAFGVVAAIGAGFHGYKRNAGSLGWGLAWGLVGALLPLPTIAFALGQGFAKRPRRRS